MIKTILVFNDHSSEAEHAAELALGIAQKMNANLLLATIAKVKEGKRITAQEPVLVAGKQKAEPVTYSFQITLQEHLQQIVNKDKREGFKPAIKSLDLSDHAEIDLAALVIKNEIWMMVKGTSANQQANNFRSRINVQSVLNRVMCPLLLVPEQFELKDFEHIVYTADLRYSRLHVTKYLAEIAEAYGADMMLAHLSAKGIPHMEENYAHRFFDTEINNRVKYPKLWFNNICERNLTTAVDVLVNGMHTDMLAMVNHRFHFEQILGRYINNALPAHIAIPVMVFPY
ncbi:universal stress protein [Mucilaginibacter sp. RS28]|uniref:Universal stress protein n=1 Tax=Mucilaginibacter straminoryzae TaxID=2932774 RepID=A0A9X1WZI7_9SPHI|nr:universal stress protein [Mucilaginibacter straminoryzae]MCJ8208507.1 universal stress protein [Mucilaginibacter straminoryzae]